MDQLMAEVLQSQSTPPLGYRFGVFFFMGGAIPNPIDFRFRKVSGLSSTINTRTLHSGGQNLYSYKVPERVQYENLVLERGMALGSPLRDEFNVAMSMFRFSPSNVLVSLLDETAAPISSWLFMNAYPVKWSLANLDADKNQVLIETMELAYQRMQAITL